MSPRRATATVLISIGVATALLEACAGTDASPGGTRSTGSGTGNGTGAGGGTGSGAGGGNSGGTTTTGGGGTAPPIDPGNPEAGADIKVTPDAACASTATKGELKQTDLLIMMDNSGSMTTMDPGQTQTRWQALATAIPPFVADPANAGMMVGLDFFPEGAQASCNVTDYSNPDVPIALIPGPGNMQATAIGTAIMGRMTSGGTPTGPALTGAIQSAKTFQMANPTRSLSVLLLTDGVPTGCGVQNANPTGPSVMAAMAGLNGTPSIKTYVLGVGPDTGNLDAIAAAGGTQKAFMATSGGAADLTAALAAIRKSTLACDYTVPKPEAGTLDPKKVTVSVQVGGMGPFVELPNVVNQAGCAGNPMNPNGLGWYYDNPTAPTKIILCPNSCGPLQAVADSQVNILLGCEPKIIPPPN